MNKIARIGVTLAIAAGTAFGIGLYSLQNTEAAIPVYDHANTRQTHLTYIEAVKTVTNTLTMIANQVKNLTSMSNGILNSSTSDINTAVADFLEPVAEIQGLCADFKTAEQSWNDAFKSVDTIRNYGPGQQIQHGTQMAETLDRTYQDTLKMQGIVSQIDQDQETLKELMQANQNAVGAKAVGQTGNQLAALSVAQIMRQQEILAAMARADIAQKAYQNQIEIESQAVAAKESANWQTIANRTNDEIRSVSGELNF